MAGNTLYLGTDDGVVTLGRRNGSWEVEHHGLKGWSVQEVAADPSAPNRVLAGTRGDGVWVSEDRGKAWGKPCYGRPGPGKVRCLTFDPRDSRRVYAGGEPIEVYVTEDLGKSWERLDSVRRLPFIDSIDYPVATVEPHIRDIAVDPTAPDTVYAALQVGGMIKSTDGGKTWALQSNANGLDCDVHTIVVDADHPNVVVVATGGHDCRSGRVKGRALYRTADGGETWAPVGMQFAQEYSVPLVPNPANPHTLYSALASGNPGQWNRPNGADAVIVRSKNGGREWEQIETGFPEAQREFPRAIAVDADDANAVYVGLRSGLMVSTDGGDTWTKIALNVPPINDMKCATA